MIISAILYIYHGIYPLVNVNKKLWNITMLFMGKFTISMAIFNSKLLVYQRVFRDSMDPKPKKLSDGLLLHRKARGR